MRSTPFTLRSLSLITLVTLASTMPPACRNDDDCDAGAACADEDYSPGLSPGDREELGEHDGLGGGESEEIGAVIDSFCGITAHQNGPVIDHVILPQGPYGYQYQCTELAYRFVCQHFDMCEKKTGAYGNAEAWYDNYADPVLGKMLRFANGGSEPPRPGDILVATNGKYGHVAIVKSVADGLVHVLEQNVYQGSHAYVITSANGTHTMAAKWAGWLRSPSGPAECEGSEPQSDCVDGGFSAAPTVNGSTLHAEGEVGANGGLLRFSLVVDQQTVHSVDYPQPGPKSDSFALDVDLSQLGLPAGTHTLGLWVKDAAQCTTGAAVDAAIIEVGETENCTPKSYFECSDGDVYWFDSCGGKGTRKEDCGADGPADNSYCMNGDVYMDYVEVGCQQSTCTQNVEPMLQQSCTDGCNGGSCGECTPHAYAECSGGDVYWFDSCNVAVDVKEDCGNDGYTGSLYCVGDAVYRDFSTVGCAGSACTAEAAPELQQSCPNGCVDGACTDMCSDNFSVDKYKCSSWSSSSGQNQELMEVCGTTDAQTGFMTIRARKNPNDPNPIFGSRPYQVRVSNASDDPCGPTSWFFNVVDDSPSGINSDELVFTFQSNWLEDQTDKAYCVTASTKPGDMGYDAQNKQQQSWWWSKKVEVSRTCQ